MNQRQSIDLILQGKGRWNHWVERLLKRQLKLIKAGKWNVSREYDFKKGYYRTIGNNPQCQRWLERATVDFSGLTFIANDAPASQPSLANQDNPLDVANIIFQRGLNIDFRDWIFPGDVRFDEAIFKAPALFNNAIFMGTAWFNDCVFENAAWFQNATFQGTASFHQVDFKSFADFQKSTFDAQANFESVRVQRGFKINDVAFKSQVPNFIEAQFTENPRIDNLTFEHPPKKKLFSPNIRFSLKTMSKQERIIRKLIHTNMVMVDWLKRRSRFGWERFINKRRNEHDESHYRALKQLADKANVHDIKRDFFAAEIRSRRHVRDKLKNFPLGTLRYLFGAAYEIISDFGRSFWRPVACSVVTFFLFTFLYLSTADDIFASKCENVPYLTPYESAKIIAYKNAFLFVGLEETERLADAQACLYGGSTLVGSGGKESSSAKSKDQARLAVEDDQAHYLARLVPYVPYYATRLGITHSLLNLVFIIMFLLVLRNYFRLR